MLHIYDMQYAYMYLFYIYIYIRWQKYTPDVSPNSAVQMVRMTTGRVKQLILVNSTSFCHTVSWFSQRWEKSSADDGDGWWWQNETSTFGSGFCETTFLLWILYLRNMDSFWLNIMFGVSWNHDPMGNWIKVLLTHGIMFNLWYLLHTREAWTEADVNVLYLAKAF